jgi:hypothetical protein
MRGWLRRGAYAAQLAGDRADLWPAGTLAWLAYLGWLPLLVVVAEPDAADLQPLGVALYSSAAFPANVIALAAALVGGVILLALLAAASELALQRAAAAPAPRGPAPAAGPALSGLAVLLVAMLPAAAAVTGLGVWIAAVARDVYTSPDLETPLLLRLAAEVWPALVVLGATVLVGQAFGAVAFRHAIGPRGEPVPGALARAASDLVRLPASRLGTAAAGTLADAVILLLSWALLRVLWAPIAADLGVGQLMSPATLLLLVGFVAIWLVLLLAGGAVHVGTSAWWALELARDGPRPRESQRVQPT